MATPTMVDIGAGRWLAPGPAASLARVRVAVREAIGRDLQISEAGRTNSYQWYLWNLYWSANRPSWLGRPAYPGTSSHESGDAIDTNDHVFGPVVRILLEHGWRRTDSSENWHWVYFPGLDKYAGSTAGSGGNVSTGEDAEMSGEEWRQMQVHFKLLQDVSVRLANVEAWISAGGPGVNAGTAAAGTIAQRIINIDRQVTGAQGFPNSVAARVIDIQNKV